MEFCEPEREYASDYDPNDDYRNDSEFAVAFWRDFTRLIEVNTVPPSMSHLTSHSIMQNQGTVSQRVNELSRSIEMVRLTDKDEKTPEGDEDVRGEDNELLQIEEIVEMRLGQNDEEIS